MHYLILDTCVLVDLAVSEFSLVPKLSRLIKDGKISIIMPDLIWSEWNGCVNTIETQLMDEVVEARRFTMRFVSFLEEIETTVLRAQFASFDPVSMSRGICAKRIEAINEILNFDSTIRVLISAQVEALAIKHALEKKAPFRMRNSMADALIFLSAAEWVGDNKPENSVFVTHNTKDFSDEKRGVADVDFKERLAPDLQCLVENDGMKFGAVIGRVLNDVEKSLISDEELQRSEAVVSRRRSKDDVIGEFMSGGGIAKLLAQEKELEKKMSGGAFVKMKKDQKKLEEMASGGVIARLLEELNKFEEISTGGAIAKMKEDQKKLEEMASGGVVRKLLEEQKKFDEIISSGVIARMIEDQRRLEKIALGGVVCKLLEEGKEFEEISTGGAIAKMKEDQKKLEEMASGGVVRKLLEEQKKFEEISIGGALAKMKEDQKRLDEIASGGVERKLLEEQRKIEEMRKKIEMGPD